MTTAVGFSTDGFLFLLYAGMLLSNSYFLSRCSPQTIIFPSAQATKPLSLFWQQQNIWIVVNLYFK